MIDPWSWVSFGIGGVVVPLVVFLAFILHDVITSAIRDHRHRRNYENYMKATCHHCRMARSLHRDMPIPGNPFNTFPACPRLTYSETPEDGEWTARPTSTAS